MPAHVSAARPGRRRLSPGPVATNILLRVVEHGMSLSELCKKADVVFQKLC